MNQKRPLATSIALIAGVVIWTLMLYSLSAPLAIPSVSPENTPQRPLPTVVATGTPVPTAVPSVTPTATLPPTPPATPSLSLTGPASWFCNDDPNRGPLSRCTVGYSDGPGNDLWAAAGPQLRVGDWRGREVTVFGPAGYSVATLVDFCACSARLVDLYADLFLEVCGPLSRGVCEVSVSW